MKWMQAMWRGAPRYTVFELPWTVLSDFDENIWWALVYNTRSFLPHMPYLFYVSSGKDSPLEVDSRNPVGESREEEFREFDPNFYAFDAEELRLVKAWVRADDLHHLETNPAPLIDVHRTYEGKTVIVHWVRSSSPRYPVNFRLQAQQFRRDRLRLVLIDYTDLSPIEYLKTWIKWGWDDEAATPLQPTPEVNESSIERGANAGTLGRVAEAHRLMKEMDIGKIDACKRARTDPRTYEQRCLEATGEFPIER